jgi:hypothetical protein
MNNSAAISAQKGPPKLDARFQSAVDRGEFEFLMPYEKPLYRTNEVAETIGRDQAYVRVLVEAKRLEAHRDSAFGTRKSNLITRRSLVLYLAETANYQPAHLVLRIEALLKSLTSAQLDRLIDTARKHQNRL